MTIAGLSLCTLWPIDLTVSVNLSSGNRKENFLLNPTLLHRNPDPDISLNEAPVRLPLEEVGYQELIPTFITHQL